MRNLFIFKAMIHILSKSQGYLWLISSKSQGYYYCSFRQTFEIEIATHILLTIQNILSPFWGKNVK